MDDPIRRLVCVLKRLLPQRFAHSIVDEDFIGAELARNARTGLQAAGKGRRLHPDLIVDYPVLLLHLGNFSFEVPAGLRCLSQSNGGQVWVVLRLALIREGLLRSSSNSCFSIIRPLAMANKDQVKIVSTIRFQPFLITILSIVCFDHYN